PPTQAVFNVLNRPQYKLLDLDLTPLHQSTVKEPSSVRLFSDASVNDINSIQDDFDIPLNNCVLNNIDYEHSLQRENSTVSLTGGIDTDLVENEETQMTSENMMVGEFSSLGTHDCLPITVGSDASSDSHGSNNEDCNQYSENQTSQSSTDIDVLAGSLGEEILIDANGSENVVTQSNRSSVNQHQNKRKRLPASELMISKKPNGVEGDVESVVKKSQKCVTSKDDCHEPSFNTPIAGRLCRTRLPIARF
ncbi:unnamed protein product, partial [Rotaria socialis]